MLKLKYLIFLFSICFSRLNFAQSFTYSGPTNVTIPYGSSTVTATYYFSYSGLTGLCYPGLIIAVNGRVINNDLCNNPSTPSSYNISFVPGSHTVKFSLLSINCNTLNCYHAIVHQSVKFTVHCKFQIRIENIFGGGSIYADGNRTSPFYRTSVSGDNVSIGAIEQNYNGYHWIWNTSGTNNSEWLREPSGFAGSSFSNSQNTSYSVQSNDMNTKVVACLRKICNINFQNSFPDVGNVGVIKVNQTQYDSPTLIFQVVEQNLINAEAVDQTLNGINYTFTNWSEAGGTNRSWTFNPTDHKTYTAYFSGTPQPPSIAFTLLKTSR
jgi:hypothetical protein